MFLVELLNNFFRVVTDIGIILVLLAIIGHYAIFGPHFPGLGRDRKDIKLFSLWERFIHAITLLSFFTLAVTGFAAVIWFKSRLSGWLLYVHLVAAPIFAIGLITVALRWAEDCRFVRSDWEWAKVFGGYLGHKGDIPADKFNGGQKGFFWAILAFGILCMLSGAGRMLPVVFSDYQDVLYLVHRYSSLLLVICVMAHIYLGTIANPGTWQILVTGKVSSRWAYLHHPQWQYEQKNGVVESGSETRVS